MLAEGSTSGVVGEQTRVSSLGELASAVIGSVGPVPAARRRALAGAGRAEPDAIVGVSGLERVLDERLRGTPGGELLAQSEREAGRSRVLASVLPRAAPALRTSVSPTVQRAAVAALGGQLGGIVVDAAVAARSSRWRESA